MTLLVACGGCNTRLRLADAAMNRADYDLACPVYEQEAKRGNLNAQTNAGTCHYYGLGGFAVDQEAGQRQWIQAARRGDIEARRNLFVNGIMWQRLFERPPSHMPTK